MGSAVGGLKRAARTAGCTYEEYLSQKALGLKWCLMCKQWKAESLFGVDKTRGDGRDTKCCDCRKVLYKKSYEPRPRVSKKGFRFVEARDGDKEQARARVNLKVQTGQIPNPTAIACSQCQHIGEDRRHEYHHFKGYAAEHHETVIALCSKCHGGESDKAKVTHCYKGHEFTPENTFRKKNGTRGCLTCRRNHDKNRGRDAEFWRKYRERKNGKDNNQLV